MQVNIDLITEDPGSGEFVMYLVEDGPWPTSDSDWNLRLRSIQDRIFSAADVAIDGLLAEKYPDSSGSPVRIQIDSPSGCPSKLEALVEAVRTFFREDPSYSAAINNSSHIAGIRVVTGKEMGRFQGQG
jgi:hypothetical protein